MQESNLDILGQLASRTRQKATLLTCLFAMGGALLMIAERFLPQGVSMLWGLWIPLCFLLIPSVHALARQNLDLEKRIEALESALQTLPSNETARN